MPNGPRLVPALLAADLTRTADFYTRLGFTTEYPDGPNPPHHRLSVHRDGVTFFFTNRPTATGQPPTLSGTLYIFPDSVDALATEWRNTIPFLWGPELMHYGLYRIRHHRPGRLPSRLRRARPAGSVTA